MIRVWQYQDEAVPKAIKKEAWRGGDEDWIVVSEAVSPSEALFPVEAGISWAFRNVVERLDTNGWDERQLSRMTTRSGKVLLVYVVCHA